MARLDLRETLARLRPMMKGIRHFTPEELLIHTGEGGNTLPPERMLSSIIPTVTVADRLREVSGVPLYVTSAYRAPEYNRRVGGVKNSQHQAFTALDLVPKPGVSPFVLKMLLIDMRGGLFELGGCQFPNPPPDATGPPRKRLDWWLPLVGNSEHHPIFRFAGGVGGYSWGVHLDTRGLNHTWEGP